MDPKLNPDLEIRFSKERMVSYQAMNFQLGDWTYGGDKPQRSPERCSRRP